MSLNPFSAPIHKHISNYTINGTTSIGALVLSPSFTLASVTTSVITVMFSLILDVAKVSFGLNAFITFSVALIMAAFITLNHLRKTHIRIDGNTKEVAYYRPKPKNEDAVSIENFSIREARSATIKVHSDGTNMLYINTQKGTAELVLVSKDNALVFALAGKLKELLNINFEVIKLL